MGTSRHRNGQKKGSVSREVEDVGVLGVVVEGDGVREQ